MATVCEQLPLRLTVSRCEAAARVANQLKLGRAIKGQRIRDRWELDQARAEKQEWAGRTAEMLSTMFNQGSVADSCNEWTAPILPEYAEFGMFVDLFVDEMRQRLDRLQDVLKQLETIPEPALISSEQPMTQTNPAAVDVVDPIEKPGVPLVVPAKPRAGARGTLIVRSAEPSAGETVAQFLRQLGLELTVVNGKNIVQHGADSSDFALILGGAAADPLPSDELFELGFCVGRFGPERCCVIQDGGAPAIDRHGVRHVALDPGDGWQLQLARHLRKGGINVDLNKLA